MVDLEDVRLKFDERVAYALGFKAFCADTFGMSVNHPDLSDVTQELARLIESDQGLTVDAKILGYEEQLTRTLNVLDSFIDSCIRENGEIIRDSFDEYQSTVARVYNQTDYFNGIIEPGDASQQITLLQERWEESRTLDRLAFDAPLSFSWAEWGQPHREILEMQSGLLSELSTAKERYVGFSELQKERENQATQLTVLIEQNKDLREDLQEQGKKAVYYFVAGSFIGLLFGLLSEYIGGALF